MHRVVLVDTSLMVLKYGLSATTVAFAFMAISRRKQLGQRVFALFYGRFCAPTIVARLAKYKDALFAPLAKMVSRDPVLLSERALRILEIGVGTGLNFQYYPERTRLIAVEPNKHFQTYFEKNREKFPHVQVEKFVVGSAEDMKEVPDGSVDVVVSTLVLCSVENCSTVLQEIRRVLVPGGRFLYVEHVPYATGSWGRLLQRVIEPVWTAVSDGCRLTRDTSAMLRQAGFDSVDETNIHVQQLLFPVRPHIYGTAVN